MTSSEQESNQVDLAEVRRLVEALDNDLQAVNADSEKVTVLKNEVAQLKLLLAKGDDREVQQGLIGTRDALDQVTDEVVTDAVKISDYLARVGRVLGL